MKSTRPEPAEFADLRRKLRPSAAILHAHLALTRLFDADVAEKTDHDPTTLDLLLRVRLAPNGGIRAVKLCEQLQKSALARDGVAPVVAPAGSPAERIRRVVEERLLSLGYRNLRILTDLSEASLDEETSVQVECERRNMACKGKVKTINGGISDVELHNIVQSFP